MNGLILETKESELLWEELEYGKPMKHLSMRSPKRNPQAEIW